MYKQVFDYNGNPYLVKTEENGELLKDDLTRQKLYQYTDIVPPSKFYPPRVFDGVEWHGASIEQYENNNKPPITQPSQLEIIVAQLQMQIVKGNVQLRETQNELANAMLEISKLKGSAE